MRRRQQLLAVVLCEMRCEQPDRSERQRAVSECLKHRRIAARRPRRFDAVVGRTFREVQHLRAVGEERRAPFAEIQPSRVELHEHPQQCRRCRPFVRHEALGLGEQLVIGERIEEGKSNHDSLVAR